MEPQRAQRAQRKKSFLRFPNNQDTFCERFGGTGQQESVCGIVEPIPGISYLRIVQWQRETWHNGQGQAGQELKT